MNKKYEQVFIVLGVITTVVLACPAFVLWVKHSLKFVISDIDDIFGNDEPDDYTPEVVCVGVDDTDEELGPTSD